MHTCTGRRARIADSTAKNCHCIVVNNCQLCNPIIKSLNRIDMIVFVIGALLKLILIAMAVLAMTGRLWASIVLVVMLALMVLFDIIVVAAEVSEGKDVRRWEL